MSLKEKLKDAGTAFALGATFCTADIIGSSARGLIDLCLLKKTPEEIPIRP